MPRNLLCKSMFISLVSLNEILTRSNCDKIKTKTTLTVLDQLDVIQHVWLNVALKEVEGELIDLPLLVHAVVVIVPC